MSSAKLTQTRMREGIWEAVLSGVTETPMLEVRHLEAVVPGLQVTGMPDRQGEWAVRIPVPLSALSDGVQTFLVCDAASGETLGHFTIIAGVVMEDDIRAEIDLLRAELDMLKRAFRRHCLETAG